MANLIQLIKDDKFDEFMEQTRDIDNLSEIFDVHGESLLHWAVTKNNVELMKYLIQKKCYINHENYRGATPLYYAAMNGATECVEYLVNQKADPRTISTFSGVKAKDVTNDKTLKDFLEKYTNDFEELLDKHVSTFAYRMAVHWRMSMNKLIHPAGNKYFGNYPEYPMARVYYKMDGLSKLIEICKEMDEKYEKYVYSNDGLDKIDDKDRCLICDCSTENMCPQCEQVCMCGECLINYDECVMQMVDIHLNNCKKLSNDEIYEEKVDDSWNYYNIEFL